METKNNDFLLKIKLSNYINSRVIDIENDDGVLEKGIFIPIDLNGLFVSQRNEVVSWVLALKRTFPAMDSFTHNLKITFNREQLNWLTNMGYKSPTIGALKEKKYFKHKK